MHIHVNILTTIMRVCILKFDIVAMHLQCNAGKMASRYT